MNLRIRLSEESILHAIGKLNNAKQNLRWSVSEALEMIAREGADVANSNYGEMANAIDYMEDENVAVIATNGEANIIAEFGAGDATLEPKVYFDDVPSTPVYPGSYSELEGTGEYYLTKLETGMGIWHWRGVPFSAVDARQGLYKAKQHIIKTASDTAKEVIKL